jgi:hypothetical protein
MHPLKRLHRRCAANNMSLKKIETWGQQALEVGKMVNDLRIFNSAWFVLFKVEHIV